MSELYINAVLETNLFICHVYQGQYPILEFQIDPVLFHKNSIEWIFLESDEKHTL